MSRSANLGDEVVLTSGGLNNNLDTAFAWQIPTGQLILYSSSLVPGQDTISYISPNFVFSRQGDGSTQSVEFDSKFSVNVSSGSLTIKSFSTSSSTATDTVTSQIGTYSFLSVRGVFNYDIQDASAPTIGATTTITTATTVATVSTSGDTTLLDVSVYYIVLGILLFLALAGFLFMIVKTRRSNEKNDEQTSLPELT